MIETLLGIFAIASGSFGVLAGFMYLREREKVRNLAAENFRQACTINSYQSMLQHQAEEKNMDTPDKDRAGIPPENRVH